MKELTDLYDTDPDQRIWQVVAAIPAGRVSTYGAVASMAGLPRGARRVGKALRDLPPDTRIPWHRVINARGRVSLSPASTAGRLQRGRLEGEGVEFNASGTIDLHRFGWQNVNQASPF